MKFQSISLVLSLLVLGISENAFAINGFQEDDNPWRVRKSTASLHNPISKTLGVAPLESNYYERQLVNYVHAYARYEKDLIRWDNDKKIAEMRQLEKEKTKTAKLKDLKQKEANQKWDKERRRMALLSRERNESLKDRPIKSEDFQSKSSDSTDVLISRGSNKTSFWTHFSKALFGK